MFPLLQVVSFDLTQDSSTIRVFPRSGNYSRNNSNKEIVENRINRISEFRQRSQWIVFLQIFSRENLRSKTRFQRANTNVNTNLRGMLS